MHILPKSRREWVGLAILPVQAYTIIGPFLAWLVDSFLRGRHTGPPDEEVYLMMGLFPCGAVLLFAALFFALWGPKNLAPRCLGFGLFALVVGYFLLPILAVAEISLGATELDFLPA